MRLILSNNDGEVLDLWEGDDLDADTVARLYAFFGGYAPGDHPLPTDIAAAFAAEGA